MVEQVTEMLRKLVRGVYPWIRSEKANWPQLIVKLQKYNPKLYHYSVVWQRLERDRVKCNTDGASKGNPGDNSIGFCIRDHEGNLLYAKAKGIGVTTNTEAESIAILEALQYCMGKDLTGVMVETYSLSLKKMIEKQWNVPWELVERVEEIRVLVHKLQASLTHTFREGNCVADALANEVVESQSTKEYNTFQELPSSIRRH
ncbi:hypothetical protein KY285_033483 [Solanum tuberosum]|nr:hypothetical protein KY285_033483 [Solanum tuberosum]